MPQNAIAIFPYLKTSEAVSYKNLTFRSTSSISDCSPEDKTRILDICGMFFLRDNYRIREMCYTILPIVEGEIVPSYETTLQEFRTLISYLYSSPHPTFGDTFLSHDHANVLVFIPKEVSIHLLADDRLCEIVGESAYPKPDAKSNIPGYEVCQNSHTHFWVTNGSQIFPPTRAFWLNLSQDISNDVMKSAGRLMTQSTIEIFERGLTSPNLEQRILTALTWYNRANSLDVDEDVALINLAVAFETLLSLEQGPDLTKRFRQTISVLLGGVPRLASWLTQFYAARSKIVHVGRADDFRFIAVESPRKIKSDAKKYRSLIDDGRDIFKLCLRTILSGAVSAKEINLSSRLYTNQERFEGICRIMTKTDLTADKKFESVKEIVKEASEYRFVEETGLELKTLVGTVRLASKAFLDAGYSAPDELVQLLVDLSQSPSDDDFLTALSVVRNIHDKRSDMSQPVSDDPLSTESLATIILLIDVVWNYTFTYYFWIRDRASLASLNQTDREPQQENG